MSLKYVIRIGLCRSIEFFDTNNQKYTKNEQDIDMNTKVLTMSGNNKVILNADDEKVEKFA